MASLVNIEWHLAKLFWQEKGLATSAWTGRSCKQLKPPNKIILSKLHWKACNCFFYIKKKTPLERVRKRPGYKAPKGWIIGPGHWLRLDGQWASVAVWGGPDRGPMQSLHTRTDDASAARRLACVDRSPSPPRYHRFRRLLLPPHILARSLAGEYPCIPSFSNLH